MKLVRGTYTDADGYKHCVYASNGPQVERIIREANGWGTRGWKEKCGLELELFEFDASKTGLIEALRLGYTDGLVSTFDTSSRVKEKRSA
jgi:hypothetical protein